MVKAKKTTGGGEKTPATGKKERKRTGASKKKLKAQYGAPTGQLAVQPPPKTAEEAKARWKERGRSAVVSGHKLRASARATWAAVTLVVAFIARFAKGFAERGLDAMTVKGIVALNKSFQVYAVADDGHSATAIATDGEEAVPATTPDVLKRGINFVAARRRGLRRILRGDEFATMRHDFGIKSAATVLRPSTILTGLQKLLSGRKAHLGTRAAAYLTEADVQKGTQLAQEVAAYLATVDGDRLESSQETKTERVLQAALELFFDDFAAGVEAVLEEQPEERVKALSLIPRKAEPRKAKAEPDQNAPTDKPPPAGDQSAPDAGAAPAPAAAGA